MASQKSKSGSHDTHPKDSCEGQALRPAIGLEFPATMVIASEWIRSPPLAPGRMTLQPCTAPVAESFYPVRLGTSSRISNESASLLTPTFRVNHGEAWSKIPECNESFDTRSLSHRPCLYGWIPPALTFCRLAQSLQNPGALCALFTSLRGEATECRLKPELSWFVVAILASRAAMPLLPGFGGQDTESYDAVTGLSL